MSTRGFTSLSNLSIRHLLVFIAVVVAAIVLWVSMDNAENQESTESDDSTPTTNASTGESSNPRAESNEESQLESEEPTSQKISGLERFKPENVIGNLDCHATYGQGEANGLAAVTFNSKDGSETAIVDENGIIDIVNTEYFIAGSHEIGRRPDGSLIFAFNTSLWQQETNTWNTPALVIQDRNVIYETLDASRVLLAADGSSFVVHEPTSIGSSRLVIRDLNSDTEAHITLPPELSPSEVGESSHYLQYSSDYSEIFFAPYRFFQNGATYWYMNVGEDELKSATLESVHYAVLTSTEHGYFVNEPPMSSSEEDFNSWEITSRIIDRTTGKTEDIWRTTVNIPEFENKLIWTKNGNWLVLNGGDSVVIDNRIGKEVFKFPAHSNPDAVLQRLSASLEEHGNGNDVGNLKSGGFFKDYLVYRREYGSIDECWRHAQKPNGFEKCRQELFERGSYRIFLDYYDLSSIEYDSPPDYTIKGRAYLPCAEASLPFRGFSEKDGELVYLTSSN